MASSSSAISKLVPVASDDKKYATNFARIITGCKVKKVLDPDAGIAEVSSSALTFSSPESKEKEGTEGLLESPVSSPAGTLIRETVDFSSSQDQTDRKADEQFKQLSKNYIALSNSLADLVNEKIKLEEENSRLKELLERSAGKIKELEQKNLIFEKEIRSELNG